MAVLDPDLDAITIRVVYDGAANAGKTTSIQALAQGFGAQSHSPAEIDGRTLYFDWLDYTGGMFEGHRIRCQVISVPGQTILASRRRYLLETADVVIFVGDSAPETQPATLSYLKGLRGVLETLDGPPVGVVLQANKRDHEDAVPISLFRAALDEVDLRVGVIETVATEGIGIRETFVFAVRLALDRVRELMRTGELQTSRPAIDSPDELLSELRRVEGDVLDLAAQSGLRQIHLNELLASAAPPVAEAVPEPGPFSTVLEYVRPVIAAPLLPASDLPSGMIWPPVNGRIILHEAMGADISIAADAAGDWSGKAGGRWQLHSPAAASFATLELGREALIKWARLHAASASVISPQRSVVLAEDGMGQFRLWQIIHAGRSLFDEFCTALDEGPTAIAAAVTALPHQVCAAAERWEGAACSLPLNMASIGGLTENGCYQGRMPDPALASPPIRRALPDLLDGLIQDLTFAWPVIRPQRRDILLAVSDKIAKSAVMSPVDLAWMERFLGALP